MSAAQHELSRYLQLELFHSLGAYRVVIDELDGRLEDLRPGCHPSPEVLRIVRDYNEALDAERHRATGAGRHPAPVSSPLGGAVDRYGAPPTIPHPSELHIFCFYETARMALEHEGEDTALAELRDCLMQRRDRLAPERDPERRARYLAAKYKHRRDEAARAYPAFHLMETPPDLTLEGWARQILDENLANGGADPLHRFLINAFVDAHLALHTVEWRQSVPLKEHLERTREDTPGVDSTRLKRCVALFTFVFAAARAVPWAFAQDANEARQLRADYRPAWDNMAPTFCMWIPTQLGLLALHHRAYARHLSGDARRSYKDFHKVQRLARDARRRMLKSPLHVAGAEEFLLALDALADYHIAELYRGDHAHVKALNHFENAYDRFDRLLGSAAEPAVANSRFYVELMLNRGKAAYEMGRLKESLGWHLRSWRALLRLLAADTGTEPADEDLTAAIDWLESVALEPELHKPDTVVHLKPVVQQLARVTVARHLTALAADVLLRLGHLLFVIRLGAEGAEPDPSQGIELEDVRDGMALSCLLRAARLDEWSTLVQSDLLKIRWRHLEEAGSQPGEAPKRSGFDFDLSRVPVDEQWPHGGETFDRISRLLEYLLLREVTQQQAEAGGEADELRALARKLLVSFFVHTDSISVRKSQVHKYLLQKPQEAPDLETRRAPFIDVVCMRRYSSIFPFLPRPSAFRVRGGGYFVRIHLKDGRTWSIAVDPGPDFVENLYRSGYGLSDVDMVVVTHDHVDHVTSLNPLLSLLHERKQLEPKAERLAVVANESVCASYDAMVARNTKLEKDRGREYDPGWAVATFSEAAERTEQNRGHRLPDIPDFLELEPISTEAAGLKGHVDMGGFPACGVRFGVRDGGPSVAFMSDAPAPPRLRDAWREHWMPALSADALVVHLSSVPLAQLRQMAGVHRGTSEVDADNTQFMEMWATLGRNARTTQQRLEYASWLKYHDPAGGGESVAPPVGRVPDGWSAPTEHLYLEGTIACAEEFRDARPAGGGGAFVVGELSEELGTFRTRVAERLNKTVFKSTWTPRGEEPGAVRALTGDIGLKISIDNGHVPRVLCSRCELDTDSLAIERYYTVNEIVEVCVKGENEGIYYNCVGHDPSQRAEPTFLEQMERYDVFGR